MRSPDTTCCIAFAGDRSVAAGTLMEVARAVKSLIDRDPVTPVLVFADDSSEVIDLDLRGTVEEVLRRLADSSPYPTSPHARSAALALANTDAEAATNTAAVRSGPGRPKLGVVAREVTLLPRHWEWLAAQPGGASVVLRKLVERARMELSPQDRTRRAQESAYRFLSALAGNLAGFEEATRKLFANDRVGFAEQVQAWPNDIRTHATKLAERVFNAWAAESDGGRPDAS